MYLLALLILLLILLLCWPAFPLQEEPVDVTSVADENTPVPPAAGEDTGIPVAEQYNVETPPVDHPSVMQFPPDVNVPIPGQIRVLPSLNNISATALQSARTQHIDTLNSILGVTAENITERRAISNGPFRAQVLYSYDKEHPFRPPIQALGSRQDAAGLPWVVARIDEIHANIPHPGAYNPIGSLREQILHYAAIQQHYEVGVFLPANDDPNSYVPQPGEIILVTYTNAATFSGGRYVAIPSMGGKMPSTTLNDNPCLGIDHNPYINIPSDVMGNNPLVELSPLRSIGVLPLDNPIGVETIEGIRKTPNGHGEVGPRVRRDFAVRINGLKSELERQGSYLTTAGGLRGIRASVTSGRTPLSLHYLGLAFDLATRSGATDVDDPDDNPYLVERYETGRRHSNGRPKYTWHVWARVPEPYGEVRQLFALEDQSGDGGRVVPIQARVISLTNTAARWGLEGIGSRSEYPGRYGHMEWWHFEAPDLIGDNTFGELLLQVHDPEDLEGSRFLFPEVFHARWDARRGYFRRARRR